jgi:hypothetical protein
MVFAFTKRTSGRKPYSLCSIDNAKFGHHSKLNKKKSDASNHKKSGQKSIQALKT